MEPGKIACDKQDAIKCWRCKKRHKACEEVLPEFFGRVSDLQRQGEHLAADESVSRKQLKAYKKAVKEYASDIDAHIRKANEYDDNPNPSIEQMQLLQFHALNRLSNAAEGILNVLQTSVSDSHTTLHY